LLCRREGQTSVAIGWQLLDASVKNLLYRGPEPYDVICPQPDEAAPGTLAAANAADHRLG